MSIRLQIKAVHGPLKGQTFPLKEGMTLGRQSGDICLADPKASSLHAKVVSGPKGLVLLDQGSKNGLKVQGEKVTSIDLTPGTSFQIGDGSFCVEHITPPDLIPDPAPSLIELEADEDPPPIVTPKAHDPNDEPTHIQNFSEATVPPPLTQAKRPKPTKFQASPETPKALPWNEILEKFSVELLTHAKSQPRVIAAFHPAIKLTFYGGPQTETCWTLGYGPRRVGSQSFDLPILDPKAPEICFELFPSPDGVSFLTQHPEVVLINGQSITSKLLQTGDIIRVLNTEIEVEMMHEVHT